MHDNNLMCVRCHEVYNIASNHKCKEPEREIGQHKITIRTPVDQPATWHNIELYLDDKPWNGVSSLNIAIEAGEMAEVTATMVANIEIEAMANVEETLLEENKL